MWCACLAGIFLSGSHYLHRMWLKLTVRFMVSVLIGNKITPSLSVDERIHLPDILVQHSVSGTLSYQLFDSLTRASELWGFRKSGCRISTKTIGWLRMTVELRSANHGFTTPKTHLFRYFIRRTFSISGKSFIIYLTCNIGMKVEIAGIPASHD